MQEPIGAEHDDHDASTSSAPPPGPLEPVKPRQLGIALLLFAATCVSTTLVGADENDVWSGLAYSVPLMAILLSHELGHYVAARIHRVKRDVLIGEKTRGVFHAQVECGQTRCDPDQVLAARQGRQMTCDGFHDAAGFHCDVVTLIVGILTLNGSESSGGAVQEVVIARELRHDVKCAAAREGVNGQRI